MKKYYVCFLGPQKQIRRTEVGEAGNGYIDVVCKQKHRFSTNHVMERSQGPTLVWIQ